MAQAFDGCFTKKRPGDRRATRARSVIDAPSARLSLVGLRPRTARLRFTGQANHRGRFDRENGSRRSEAFETTELYEQIGRLKMELDWLKQKAAQFAE